MSSFFLDSFTASFRLWLLVSFFCSFSRFFLLALDPLAGNNKNTEKQQHKNTDTKRNVEMEELGDKILGRKSPGEIKRGRLRNKRGQGKNGQENQIRSYTDMDAIRNKDKQLKGKEALLATEHTSLC